MHDNAPDQIGFRAWKYRWLSNLLSDTCGSNNRACDYQLHRRYQFLKRLYHQVRGDHRGLPSKNILTCTWELKMLNTKESANEESKEREEIRSRIFILEDVGYLLVGYLLVAPYWNHNFLSRLFYLFALYNYFKWSYESAKIPVQDEKGKRLNHQLE